MCAVNGASNDRSVSRSRTSGPEEFALALVGVFTAREKTRVFFCVDSTTRERVSRWCWWRGYAGAKRGLPGVDPVSPNIRPSPPRSRKKKKKRGGDRLTADSFSFFFGATSELMGSWMGQRYGNIRPRFSELNRGWPQKSSAKALYRPRIFLTAPAKGRLEYFGGR